MSLKSLKEKHVKAFDPSGVEVEMLRYRPNKLSYDLGLLGIILFAVGFAVSYSGTDISGSSTKFNLFGITSVGFVSFADILINILLLLFFLSASMEMEAYSIKFGIMAIVGGVWQVLRSLTFPLAMRNAGLMSDAIFTTVFICFALSGVSIIVGGVVSIIKGSKLRAFLSTQKAIQNERVAK